MLPQKSFIAFCLLTLCGTACAGMNEACSSALIKDVDWSRVSKSDKVRIGLSFDQTTFDNLNQGANANVSTPIYGVPAQGGASWTDAKSHQDALKENYKFASNSDTSALYATAKISEAAFSAYSNCLAKDAVGVSLALEQVLGDSIKVHVIFNTAAGDNTKRYVVVSAANADLAIAPSGQSKRPILSTHFDEDFTFKRNSATGVVVISANVLDDADQILESKTLDGIPPQPKLLHRTWLLSALHRGPDADFNFGAGKDHGIACVPLSNPEGKFVNSHLVWSWTDQTSPHVSTFWPPNTPVDKGTEVCVSQGCAAPAGANCAGVFHVETQEQIPGPWEDADQ